MFRRRFDRPFFITTLALVIVGFFIFTSASLGLLAREGARFSSVAFNQLAFGIGLGGLLLFGLSAVSYKVWRKYSLHLFIASVFLTLLVFVPGMGIESGGAHRWLSIGPYTFQPAEALKIGFVFFFASWLSTHRRRLDSFRYGLFPFLGLLGLIGAVLLAQPDTGTFLVIAATGGAMYIASGAKWRDVIILGLTGLVLLAVLAFFRPYVAERIITFINPAEDPLGSSYQLQQSLIAIGSGEIFGRGFGQSIQKFNYLPEPIGDSIFAVAAEEFGFVGGITIIGLFLFLAFRGYAIAARAPDYFAGLLVVGLVSLIVIQSFVNIASMVGVLPLTGLPLLFISHGGSAMLAALAQIGIILGVSRYARKSS